MSRPSSGTPHEQDLWLQHVILLELVTLHPDHLTLDELGARMEDGTSGTDRLDITDSLQELKRSGLIRINGGVIEPTFAALRAAAIFEF